MALQIEKITALYERLSDSDDLASESMSIANQKLILERYAEEHGFTNIRHFSDDGTSGTVFNRPGLNAMVEEVKAGNVSTVIIKDQSRIGRDVLEVGLLKRTFEEHGVRFIAAQDGLDTANGFDIMSMFRDVFNEFYVADCSKKQRAVKRAKALAGIATNRPPYGYKATEIKNVWEIDETAAVIVREIYRRFIAGDGTYTIAKDFHKREVPTPTTHYQLLQGITPTKQHHWTTTTVIEIIDNPRYIGKYVTQRKTTSSYKNHKQFIKPEDEWIIIENHHPPIVDVETYELAKKLRANRRRVNRYGYTTALSGLLKCADCGRTLTYVKQRSCEGYVCASYRSSISTDYAGTKCSRHYISYADITAIVLAKIQETVALAQDNYTAFASRVHKISNKDAEKSLKKKNAELNKAERRIAELDTIINRIYEDRVSGTLTEERFKKMLDGYETEQAELAATVKTLKVEIDDLESKTANTESFMKLVSEFGEVTELTEKAARTFIDRVIIHEAKIAKGTRRKRESQAVEVYFTYIGQFDISD